MRGWGTSVLLVALLVAVSCTASFARGPLSVVPVIGDPPTPTATTAPRAVPQARANTEGPFPYPLQVEWHPSPQNYDYGRTDGSVDFIVIHYTEISYARTISAFTNPYSYVSAHYVVRNDGHVTQMVGEDSTAWHAGNSWYNDHSVGIEIEKSDETNPDFTEAEYRAAAMLVCGVSQRWGVPLDRDHVIGHSEVPGTDHTDPGPTFSWEHFTYLVSLCAAATPANVHAAFVGESSFPTVPAGQPATVSVTLRNTGEAVWRKGTPSEARLGVPGNDPKYGFLADGWLTATRVAVQNEDVVAPGENATFTFAMQSWVPGTYTLPLRGVIDGGAWMDDLGMYMKLTVRQ